MYLVIGCSTYIYEVIVGGKNNPLPYMYRRTHTRTHTYIHVRTFKDFNVTAHFTCSYKNACALNLFMLFCQVQCDQFSTCLVGPGQKIYKFIYARTHTHTYMRLYIHIHIIRGQRNNSLIYIHIHKWLDMCEPYINLVYTDII